MSYPFGVPGLLLPPPPPPSPPPPLPPPPPSVAPVSAEIKHAAANESVDNGKTSAANQTLAYNYYQQEGHVNQHTSIMHARPSMPPLVNQIPFSLANRPGSGLMMLGASHLSLPPPPPPPPPTSSSCDSTNVGTQNGLNTSKSNYIGQRSQRFGEHAIRKGPPPIWHSQKKFPPGLQGPWKTSVAEATNHSLESTGLPTVGSVEISVPPNGSSDGSNSLAPNSGMPKLTPASTTYKDHKVNPKDPRLPKELTDLFEALNCKLCEVVSSSTVQAKHHYSGKPHEKKVRSWLQKWSEDTGNPVPKRQKLDTVVDINPEDLYCQVCEVTFTSVKHGEQHKMGKPHQKALRLGYSTSKMKTKKYATPVDPTGRFGIGESFKKETVDSNKEDAQIDVKPNVMLAPSLLSPKVSPFNNKFFCELCQISTTSQEHLDSHYAGSKHRKALVNAAKSGIKPETSVVPPPVEPAESILASVIGFNDAGLSRSRTTVSNDLSIYRTPSGQFYCHPCNTTVNSEKSFKEHSESKRHKFKVASSKRC